MLCANPYKNEIIIQVEHTITCFLNFLSLPFVVQKKKISYDAIWFGLFDITSWYNCVKVLHG